MARTRASGSTAEKLVVQALRRGLECNAEARLVKAGTKPEGAGLFDAERTAAQKEAIKLCLDQKLLEVIRIETIKAGRSLKEHRFVTITPAGVNYLAQRLTSEEADALLRTRLGYLDGQVHELELQLAQTIEAQRQGLEAVESLCTAYAQRLTDMAARIANELQALQSQAETVRSRLRPSTPSGIPHDGGAQFASAGPDRPDLAESRRRLAREMVVAWENITDPTAREWVESALFNAGVEPIGTVGEHTEFVGRLHDCAEPGAFSGKLVQIIQPGWLLREAEGEFLLTKAKVQLAPPQPTE